MSNAVWIAATNPSSQRTGLEVYSDHLLSCCCANSDLSIALFTLEPDAKRLATTKALSLLSPWPAMCYPWRLRQSRMRLRRLLSESEPVIVFFDHLQTAFLLRTAASSGALIVYLSQNHESSNYADWRHKGSGSAVRSVAFRIDAIKVKLTEMRMLRRAAAVGAITDADAIQFRRDGAQRVSILSPRIPRSRPKRGLIDQNTPRRVLHFGSYEWAVKVINLRTFVEAALPVCQAADITISIAGPGDPSKVCPTGAPRCMEFLGRVPDPDLTLLWETVRCAVVFEPSGGGFKMKLLSLAAAGVPIFTLSATAASLNLEHEVSCMAYESAPELVEGIAEHIDDYDLLNRLADGAARVLEEMRGEPCGQMNHLLRDLAVLAADARPPTSIDWSSDD